MYSDLINYNLYNGTIQISKLEEPTSQRVLSFDSNTDDEWCDKIMKILGDKYSVQILNATRSEPKSVVMIFSEVGIPVSTIYRRLQNLLDAKMLSVSGEIDEDGKKLFLYKSKVKEIHTAMNGGIIKTRLILANSNEPM